MPIGPRTIAAPLNAGRRVVDGGLVDNLPVAEVRDLCRPDVVIAVNVGSPPLPPEQVTALLGDSTAVAALRAQRVV